MSLSNNCHLNGIIGSWKLKNTSILLNKTSTIPIKGNGSTLGLNNDGSSAAGYLNLYRSSYNEAILSTSGGTRGNVHVTTNSSKSGLVGDITNGLTVYVFERIS